MSLLDLNSIVNSKHRITDSIKCTTKFILLQFSSLLIRQDWPFNKVEFHLHVNLDETE